MFSLVNPGKFPFNFLKTGCSSELSAINLSPDIMEI